jgi:hypothetical protein
MEGGGESARTPALSRARLTHIHTLRALSSSARALSRKRSGKYMLTCMRAHMRDTRQEDTREGGGGREREKRDEKEGGNVRECMREN